MFLYVVCQIAAIVQNLLFYSIHMFIEIKIIKSVCWQTVLSLSSKKPSRSHWIIKHRRQGVEPSDFKFRPEWNLMRLSRFANTMDTCVTYHIRLPVFIMVGYDRLGYSPPEFIIIFVRPCKYRYVFFDQCSGDLVLRWIDIACGPAYTRSQFDECFNENGCLCCYMRTGRNTSTKQRLVGFCASPQRHQAGHFWKPKKCLLQLFYQSFGALGQVFLDLVRQFVFPCGRFPHDVCAWHKSQWIRSCWFVPCLVLISRHLYPNLHSLETKQWVITGCCLTFMYHKNQWYQASSRYAWWCCNTISMLKKFFWRKCEENKFWWSTATKNKSIQVVIYIFIYSILLQLIFPFAVVLVGLVPMNCRIWLVIDVLWQCSYQIQSNCDGSLFHGMLTACSWLASLDCADRIEMRPRLWLCVKTTSFSIA